MVGYSPSYQGADVRPLHTGYFLQLFIVCPWYQYPDGHFVLSRHIRLTVIHVRLLCHIVMILLFYDRPVKVVLSPFYYHYKANIGPIASFVTAKK
jgi:hypothetical protein